ncbi:hypothetical protein FEM48_Zijuj03G0054700 [Ziziphus jujuba var. spinosa]|uniref:Uncharacterized protein n=1 Tax=Ziziphus jujuba var. spinosa TaxID=714518 RepID=A0A978VNG1_ZIZJJ|nr:hypothetical protein FEM48_Zijuj03G0054700 [Ziziphus jujuba var. spinosa]
MEGGQLCPVDHFIPNEGDKSDPSGDWVTFVPPSSLRSISGHPLRSIVDLASPSPSKHLAGLDLIFRRKKLDFGGKLPFEAFLAGEFIFCCILPLFIDLPSSPGQGTLGTLRNSLQVHQLDQLPVLLLVWFHLQLDRNSWLDDSACRSLWRDSIAPNIWHCWSSRGKDPDDLSSKDISLDDPFSIDITKLSVGYLDDADMVVHVLASKGVKMVPFELKYAVDSVQGIVNFTMDVDMLAHFDEWQRLGQDDDYENQDQWPLNCDVPVYFQQ